jgi:hypothetical protein
MNTNGVCGFRTLPVQYVRIVLRSTWSTSQSDLLAVYWYLVVKNVLLVLLRGTTTLLLLY